ncbi:MAG: hypothetical protein QM734_10615, partial [Cyclobacteriaceae bacterium]
SFSSQSTYVSTGVEVKFDINVMRLLPQLDIGFRYPKGLTPSTSLFELLIGSINFSIEMKQFHFTLKSTIFEVFKDCNRNF